MSNPDSPKRTTAKQKRMKKAVAFLKNYIETYDKQHAYENYSDETYINDILYGLGASLSDDYKWASGFTKFKEFLVKEFITLPIDRR
jgi:hypothetical protein